MPLYVYKCQVCNKETELLESKISLDSPPIDCPECGVERSAIRQLSSTSFSLQGNGWYKDGYHERSSKSPSSD